MAKFFLLDFKINIDNHKNDIISLLKIIKPSWKGDSVNIEPILGGYSSKIYRCYEESGPLDSVTVRITHLAEKTTEEELQIIQYLSKNDHFPTIHAIFANGYCYDYIKGKTIIIPQPGNEGRINDLMLSAIAKEMAYIHKIKLDCIDYTKTSFPNVFESYFSKRDFDRIDENSPSKETIFEEIKFLYEYILKKEARIVTCHGDCHPGNFIWNDEYEKVTFVDWEGVHAGYQMQNIAYFFITSGILLPMCSDRTAEQVLPSDYKKKFFRSYLEEWYSTNDEKRKITEDEIDAWLKECEYHGLIPILALLSSSLAFGDIMSEASGDKRKCYDLMLTEYLSLKEKLLGRRSFENRVEPSSS